MTFHGGRLIEHQGRLYMERPGATADDVGQLARLPAGAVGIIADVTPDSRTCTVTVPTAWVWRVRRRQASRLTVYVPLPS